MLCVCVCVCVCVHLYLNLKSTFMCLKIKTKIVNHFKYSSQKIGTCYNSYKILLTITLIIIYKNRSKNRAPLTCPFASIDSVLLL